jgi:hypothetical protein
MAAGTIYNGKNLRLSFDGKKLYHATSCSMTIASKTQEVATKDTTGDILVIDGYNGSLSTDALWSDIESGETLTQVSPSDLLALQIAGTVIAFEFTTGVTGDVEISGNCYCTNTDLGAENGSKATAAFQFATSGDISIGVVGA